MKYFFTFLLIILFLFNTKLAIGQNMDQQEREKIAMTRFAEELDNSSQASEILWGRIVIAVILIGVLSMDNQANEKEKWQAFKRQQREFAARNQEGKMQKQ